MDANLTDFGTITISVGVAATGTLKVTDSTTAYPAGRRAGFMIAPVGLLSDPNAGFAGFATTKAFDAVQLDVTAPGPASKAGCGPFFSGGRVPPRAARV